MSGLLHAAGLEFVRHQRVRFWLSNYFMVEYCEFFFNIAFAKILDFLCRVKTPEFAEFANGLQR